MRAGGVDPVGHMGKRGFPVIGRFIRFHIRQAERELAFWKRHISTFVAVHNRDRFTPVALAGEHPVAQLEVNLAAADTLLLQIGEDLFLGFLHRQAVQDAGIDQDTGGAVRERCFFHIAALNHFDDRKVKFLRKFPVARIVAGNSHDGAGSVRGEYVIGDKDRDLLSVDRVDGGHTVQANAGLILGNLRALKIGFTRCGFLVCLNFIPILDLILPLAEQGMLRGKNHICHAVERIGAGCENGEFVARGGSKINFRAGGTADPVFLLCLHALGIIHEIEIVDEAIRIRGDFKHPLRLDFMHHRAAAAFTHAFHDFLIGKNTFAGGAPVDGHLFFIGETVLEELQENPLRPFVIIRVCGVDFTGPIKRNTQRADLLLKACNVLLRYLGRMHMVFDGIIFSGQAESVPTDRVEDIISLHSALSCDNIESRVRAWMAHVQSLTGGIRKFHQRVVLRLCEIVGGVIDAGFFPAVLPFLFNVFVVVLFTLHCCVAPTFSNFFRDHRSCRTAQTLLLREVFLNIFGNAVFP